jgi:hypothetical protein
VVGAVGLGSSLSLQLEAAITNVISSTSGMYFRKGACMGHLTGKIERRRAAYASAAHAARGKTPCVGAEYGTMLM